MIFFEGFFFIFCSNCFFLRGFFNFGAEKTQVKEDDTGGKANRAKKWTDPV
jgi:hypothetical protein